MKAKPARIYLKTPERKWLWRGGLAACALPIMFCLGLMLFSFLGINDEAPQGAIYITSRETLFFLTAPLAGILLAAYLGTREIRKKNQCGFAGKRSFIWIAVKSGFNTHWVIASLLYLLVLVFVGIDTFVSGFILICYYTFLLWGLITLPVSVFCGFVFWFVAVRGSENLSVEVFD